MNGTIFDIKEFGVHDGPGLRTTVFLKGCPLRCVWCHNPEGLSPHPQFSFRQSGCQHCGLCYRPCQHEDCQPFGRCLHICPNGLLKVVGETISAEELANRLRRNEALFDGKGYVTFSGGEPLMQHAFLLEVAEQLQGYSLAIETSGYAKPKVFRQVIRRMDLVYMDVKLADDAAHKVYTGVSNQLILQNLEILRESGIPCVIRTPMIPGITDIEENLSAIRKLIGELPWEHIPYNPLVGAKYAMFDMEFPYDKVKKQPV